MPPAPTWRGARLNRINPIPSPSSPLLVAFTVKASTRGVVPPKSSAPRTEGFLLLRPISLVPVEVRFWPDFLLAAFLVAPPKISIRPAEVTKPTTAHQTCCFPKVKWKARSSIPPWRIRTWRSEGPTRPGNSPIILWRVISRMPGMGFLEGSACPVEVSYRLAFHFQSHSICRASGGGDKHRNPRGRARWGWCHSERILHQGRAGCRSCRRCLIVCPYTLYSWGGFAL